MFFRRNRFHFREFNQPPARLLARSTWITNIKRRHKQPCDGPRQRLVNTTGWSGCELLWRGTISRQRVRRRPAQRAMSRPTRLMAACVGGCTVDRNTPLATAFLASRRIYSMPRHHRLLERGNARACAGRTMLLFDGRRARVFFRFGHNTVPPPHVDGFLSERGECARRVPRSRTDPRSATPCLALAARGAALTGATSPHEHQVTRSDVWRRGQDLRAARGGRPARGRHARLRGLEQAHARFSRAGAAVADAR